LRLQTIYRIGRITVIFTKTIILLDEFSAPFFAGLSAAYGSELVLPLKGIYRQRTDERSPFLSGIYCPRNPSIRKAPALWVYTSPIQKSVQEILNSRISIFAEVFSQFGPKVFDPKRSTMKGSVRLQK
jgi:hypothetical protein